MFSTSAIVLIVCLALTPVCLGQQKQQSLASIFTGVWTFQASVQKTAEGKLSGDPTEMFTVLNVSETENRHSAVYSDWEREHNYVLSVEWQSVTAGEVRLTELKAVPEGDEEKAEGEEFVGGLVPSGKPELLFAFDFTNRSNAFVFAQGEFHGIKGKYAGTYSFTFPSALGFVFTLHAKSGEIITVTAGKNIAQTEPTIFQRIMQSPMIMVAMFMLVRMYLMRGKTDPAEQLAATTAAAGRPGARATARSTPTVEEVTDKKNN